VIADGTYDVFVVDASPLADQTDPSSPATGWQLELTILAGPHKGDVVTIRAEQLRGVEFDLIGMPGTLTVVDGEPSFRLDA
jgi:hypothetical protein